MVTPVHVSQLPTRGPEMTLQKFVAATVSALLASCSATRHVSLSSTSLDSPSRFVLILQEHPDGQLTHVWHPVESFELSAYQLHPDSQVGQFVPVTARPRDCDQENQDCYRKCMDRPLPPGYGGFTSPRKRGGKSEFCRGECQQAYDDCLELERLRPQEFTATDGAIDWLKRHRAGLLVGSVIIIAGVTFVVVSAGAGLVVLAPVILMTSPELQHGVPVAEGPR
ncbi:hypothetical protein [Hyalangium rubrum]|uniref:Lipoprotein n=1 Tax=Hyalangium rubrum TaxID=3103134 RepID=A0ABU5HDD4_9BACT|nr:hypothetical protein [Hyalangium sp. s54d21]MDY7231285.1 hypothetical protein [Hyalangium sp. s54d21]